MFALAFAIRWLSFWSVYMVLAGKWKPDEVVAGCIVSFFCAAFAHLLLPRNDPAFRFSMSWISNLLRALAKAFTDSIKVFGAALGPKDLTGKVSQVPYRFGNRSPLDMGRTAWVTETLCLTPNTVVLECDAERGLLLVHELVPSPEPVGGGDLEWPS